MVAQFVLLRPDIVFRCPVGFAQARGEDDDGVHISVAVIVIFGKVNGITRLPARFDDTLVQHLVVSFRGVLAIIGQVV